MIIRKKTLIKKLKRRMQNIDSGIKALDETFKTLKSDSQKLRLLEQIDCMKARYYECDQIISVIESSKF